MTGDRHEKLAMDIVEAVHAFFQGKARLKIHATKTDMFEGKVVTSVEFERIPEPE